MSAAERGAGHHDEGGPAGLDRRLGQLVAEPLDEVKQPRQSSGSTYYFEKLDVFLCLCLLSSNTKRPDDTDCRFINRK
jgi:hypothetical protein